MLARTEAKIRAKEAEVQRKLEEQKAAAGGGGTGGSSWRRGGADKPPERERERDRDRDEGEKGAWRAAKPAADAKEPEKKVRERDILRIRKAVVGELPSL